MLSVEAYKFLDPAVLLQCKQNIIKMLKGKKMGKEIYNAFHVGLLTVRQLTK